MRRTLLLLILFLMVPRVVNACGCYNTNTVLDDYEESDLVIAARLKAVIKGTTPNRFNRDISHVTMIVEKVFKGSVKIGEELTFGSGDPVLGCSWTFFDDSVGDTYLLYLYRPEKPSEPFYVSTCNRSQGLENAHDDLRYLENMDKLRGRTRVSGSVTLEGADFERREGHRVRITGTNKAYSATTDKHGLFELYDLPPGRYSIEPVLEPGWKVEQIGLSRKPTRAELMEENPRPRTKEWFTLRPKRHFGVSIRLRGDNRVAGRVTTPAGHPLNHVCVSLVPSNTKPNVCNAFTEPDGTFIIESVDPGAYNLLVNYQNIRSSDHPFPKLYYPGVSDAEAARVFTVKFGESIERIDFVVPTVYETVKFVGMVRYANGRPASHLYVGFTTPKTAEVDGFG
jgi:hypothetical protein